MFFNIYISYLCLIYIYLPTLPILACFLGTHHQPTSLWPKPGDSAVSGPFRAQRNEAGHTGLSSSRSATGTVIDSCFLGLDGKLWGASWGYNPTIVGCNDALGIRNVELNGGL